VIHGWYRLQLHQHYEVGVCTPSSRNCFHSEQPSFSRKVQVFQVDYSSIEVYTLSLSWMAQLFRQFCIDLNFLLPTVSDASFVSNVKKVLWKVCLIWSHISEYVKEEELGGIEYLNKLYYYFTLAWDMIYLLVLYCLVSYTILVQYGLIWVCSWKAKFFDLIWCSYHSLWFFLL
jgi:hypothetical protein